MERKKYSREFKHEAVNLVTERGVSVVQASRDLDLNHNVLRRGITKRQTPLTNTAVLWKEELERGRANNRTVFLKCFLNVSN